MLLHASMCFILFFCCCFLLFQLGNSSTDIQHCKALTVGVLVSQSTSSDGNSSWVRFLDILQKDCTMRLTFCVKRESNRVFFNPKLVARIKLLGGYLDISTKEYEVCGLEQFLSVADSDSSQFVLLDSTSPYVANISGFEMFQEVQSLQQRRSFRIDANFTIISSAISQFLRTSTCDALSTNKALENLRNCLELATGNNVFPSMNEQNCHSSITHTADTSVVDLKDSFHESGPCQLWWPLNLSELFIHSDILPNLSPLRMKQKFIIACFNHEESHFQEYNILLEDKWSSRDCNDCSSYRSVTLPAYDIPQIFESSVDFHYDEQIGRVSKKHITIKVSRSDNEKVISQFSLVLNVKYGSQYWEEHSSDPHSKCPIHPMASQLETRDDLGFALNALLPNASSFLEVGVQHGNFAHIMLNTWKNLRSYVAIDPWKAWPSTVYYDIANNVQSIQDQIFLHFLLDIEKYGERVSVLRMESLEAATVIAEESIDVIYLDAMHHYYAVKSDLEAWWPKVKPGGILSGHDYVLDVMHSTIFSAKPAVEEFARRHGLIVLYTNDDNRPAYPTWFLYKPCY